MAARGHVLALLVLLALAGAAAAGGGRHPHSHRHRHGRKSARLRLIPSAPGASLADRARDDRHRHAYIRSTLASRRRAAEVGASAFAMPLSSGAYTGTGQYFVRFRVGTPAQPFVLVADTGSDLTWVKCRGAAGSPPDAQPPAREFRPAASKSWAPIACSSDTCTSYVPFSLANCSTPASPCAYDYRSVPLSMPLPCLVLHRSITSYRSLHGCVLATPPDLGTIRPWWFRFGLRPRGGAAGGDDTAAAGRLAPATPRQAAAGVTVGW